MSILYIPWNPLECGKKFFAEYIDISKAFFGHYPRVSFI